MSSGDDDCNRSGPNEESKASKKRRVQRACDTCRRKKIKCDGTTEGSRCSNCAAYKYECTYIEAAKKRGPPKGYVESLEARLQHMETLLQSACPDADFTKELGVHMDRETWYNERQKRGNTSPAPVATTSNFRQGQASTSGTSAQSSARGFNHVSDEMGISDDDHAHLPDDLQRMAITSKDRRFHGKSSGLVLIQTAMDMKREYTGGESSNSDQTDFWSHPEWEGKRSRGLDDNIKLEFPPPDLMESLIPLYFFHNNLYLPLLHRPTFERQYNERLHESDNGFASILLLVCAIASRWSDDPRVLRPDQASGSNIPISRHSAGWKYFDQVQMQRKSLVSAASLFDLQQYALAAIFLQGSAAPYSSWVIVGIGLRVAQDIGAHRNRMSDAPVERELWKRAFWVLVNLDRVGSAALGRPCAIHDEDFDLDLPLEVDDEYWETLNPEDAFKQPLDIPSTVAYFNVLIRLDQILSFLLRTIYSINKSKSLLGFAGHKDWAQSTVVELDTSLNQWLDTVPNHLRWDLCWDHSEEFSVFFQQSAILYATYYHIQVLVHRPFIPRPGKPAPLTYPSLAICTNAARSCSQVLQALRRKCDAGSAPHLMFFAFTSGLVLLLNIWGMRKEGLMGDAATPMRDVHMCMQFLKTAETRWHLAGRLCNILCELASVGDFPLPQSSPGPYKRSYDSDSPKSLPTPEYVAEGSAHVETPPQSRPIRRPHSLIASSRHSAAQSQLRMQPTGFDQRAPMNSDDLGRMPLHPDPAFLQPLASGSGSTPPLGNNPMGDLSWFVPQPDMSGVGSHPGSSFATTTSGQSGMHLYGTGAANQELYPASAPPFGGSFTVQPGVQDGFSNTANGIPEGAQNPSWGDTINMWSTAPTGFVWEDWNNFTNRLDEQHPPP